MGVYCYENPETGEIIDAVFPHDNIPDVIVHDGVKCPRNFKAQWENTNAQMPGNWPLKSQALAVHPDQSREYSKFCADHGVPTHYDERGRPELRSKAHRKAHAELRGATDFDGGYGDPVAANTGEKDG